MVLNGRELLRVDGMSVSDVRCDGGVDRWSPEELVGSVGIVLLRTGSFRRRSDGVEVLVDPMVGYVQWPGSVQQVAHPCGGDVCTVIGLSHSMFGSLVDPDNLRRGVTLSVSPAVDLAHRLLIRRIHQKGEECEVAEHAVVLAGGLLEGRSGGSPGSSWARTSTRLRRLVDEVRRSLWEDPGLSLRDLAGIAGVSAYHLSRTFRAGAGLTVSRYRIRVRTRMALERLDEGERDLAGLAAELGFSDQAHLTRTLRHETDTTPARLRDLLGESG